MATNEDSCPVCEIGILEDTDNIISELDGYIFIEKGKICTHCGEEFVSEEDTLRTINAAKKLGVWPEPLKLYRTLSRSGNSLTLRIPSDIERQMNLKANMEVSITKIGNKIVIEPLEMQAGRPEGRQEPTPRSGEEEAISQNALEKGQVNKGPTKQEKVKTLESAT